MIQLLAFDPINHWIILEERNSLSLLKPPYRSIDDKVFLTQEKLEEAISKRGFLPESKTFSNTNDVISFMEDKKKQQRNSDVSDSNDSEDFYSFIPERPLVRFLDKYSPKITELSFTKLENLKYITEVILFRNPIIKEKENLKNQFLKLNESCVNQIALLNEAKANKFKDLSKNDNMSEMNSNINLFLSRKVNLLRIAQ